MQTYRQVMLSLPMSIVRNEEPSSCRRTIISQADSESRSTSRLNLQVLTMQQINYSIRLTPFVLRNGANFINFVSLNTRSIVIKLSEWNHLIYACDYDIILITETWLNSEIPSNLLDPLLTST